MRSTADCAHAVAPARAPRARQLISDGRTGRSKGYAFITFAEEASAVAVRALGRIAFQGRYVDVGAPCGPKPPGARHGIPTERRVFVGGLPREARATRQGSLRWRPRNPRSR